MSSFCLERSSLGVEAVIHWQIECDFIQQQLALQLQLWTVDSRITNGASSEIGSIVGCPDCGCSPLHTVLSGSYVAQTENQPVASGDFAKHCRLSAIGQFPPVMP